MNLESLEVEKIKKIVDYMIETGINNSMSGSYYIDFEDISKLFGCSVEWITEHSKEICDEVDSREEILSETWLDYDKNGKPYSFDINFCLMYLKNYDEEDYE